MKDYKTNKFNIFSGDGVISFHDGKDRPKFGTKILVSDIIDAIGETDSRAHVTDVINNKIERRGIKFTDKEVHAIIKDMASEPSFSRLKKSSSGSSKTVVPVERKYKGGSTIYPKNDPEIKDGDTTTVGYKKHDGELFVDGITSDDVRQGQVGNCYFLAALAAVADTDPELIKNNIKEYAPDCYQVTLYHQGKPKVFLINNKLPTNKVTNGKPYAKSTDQGELWVSLYEKAYSQLTNGYGASEGGQAWTAFSVITGTKGTDSKHSCTSKTELYKRISDAVANDHPIAVDTGTVSDEVKSLGLVPHHVYTILGIETGTDGTEYVVVRNPWGAGEWQGSGSDTRNDGTFRVPFDEYYQLFRKTTICNI